MKLKSWSNLLCRLLSCVFVAAQPITGQAQDSSTPPAIEVFFQRELFGNALLSPSGRLVAVRVGAKGSRDRLAVVDLDSKKVVPVASFDDADIGRMRWVNDKRLVFDLEDKRLAAGDRRFAFGLFAVNADGSGYRQLVQREKVWVSNGETNRQLPWNTFLLSQTGPQDSDYVMVQQPEVVTSKSLDYFNLLRLNTVTGLPENIDAPSRAFDWLLDDKGELRAVQTAVGDTAAIYWRDPANDKWRKLREFKRFGANADMAFHAVAPDGKWYVSARHGRDTQAVFAFDPATDTLAQKPLAASPQYDIEPHFIMRDNKMLGIRLTVDAEATQWYDEGMKAQQAEVDKLLPNTNNELTPPKRGDSPWVLVRAFSDVQPSLYFAYHAPSKKLTRLGQAMPDVKPAQMSQMDMVRFKARDGLEIPAYLTLPVASATKKNLPLIVYVHGGPWVRGATWRWQPDVQFLASRGYAVLQPEFRGSTGFGMKHFNASFKQWGLTMQDDLADAARWAIGQGIADPKRICVMGASYGGYATLMGLAKDGDLFKCGVEWVGVSDILLMYDAGWSDMSDDWKRYGMPLMIGDRERDAAQLAATSPINLAAKIKNPLLMAHGRIDSRVPIEHGKRMYDAVKLHNPNVEFVQYDKDGHGWSLPETQVDWWTRVEKFLATHIPAAK
jgi:dipeptidyl aminopeptidase/acylaminoacyl peptidase